MVVVNQYIESFTLASVFKGDDNAWRVVGQPSSVSTAMLQAATTQLAAAGPTTDYTATHAAAPIIAYESTALSQRLSLLPVVLCSTTHTYAMAETPIGTDIPLQSPMPAC